MLAVVGWKLGSSTAWVLLIFTALQPRRLFHFAVDCLFTHDVTET